MWSMILERVKCDLTRVFATSTASTTRRQRADTSGRICKVRDLPLVVPSDRIDRTGGAIISGFIVTAREPSAASPALRVVRAVQGFHGNVRKCRRRYIEDTGSHKYLFEALCV